MAAPPPERTASGEVSPTHSALGEPLRSVKTTKVGFVSLGCPKNLVDSEVMMGLLARAGVELTPTAEDADVIVVNTCSFIESAKQESVDAILEMAQHKLDGRARRLVVAGCLVERYREEIRKNIPEVDAVVGTGELDAILAAAGIPTEPPSGSSAQSPFVLLGPTASPSRAEGTAREAQGRFARDQWDGAIADLPNYLYNETTPRILATPGHSAYIKIAEGCDHPCGFCIIPQLRGKFRSRRFESVVAEAERLVWGGVREITLIGLRFLYAYPNKITGRLLETIAAHPTICSYIDVPLQHASAAVLKRMKRGGGPDVFLRSIEKMRATIPDVTLRTTFIVGFPGETDRDFEELCEFVKQARFDWMGAFGYSDEEGAAAHNLEGKVPSREIERRRKRLMHIQRQISRTKKKRLVGTEMDLLLEGPSEETDLLLEGRTQMHAPEIDGKVYINDLGDKENALPGQFLRCEITEAHDYDLVARII